MTQVAIKTGFDRIINKREGRNKIKLRDASGVLALLRSPEAELGRASKCAVEPRKPKP
jgi:hypothetical protein